MIGGGGDPKRLFDNQTVAESRFNIPLSHPKTHLVVDPRRLRNHQTKSFFLIIMLALLSGGCGVSQSEFDKLRQENGALKKEIDELKFGADRLVAQIEKAYAAKDYPAAKTGILQLAERHPQSPKNIELARYLPSIEAEEQKVLAQKAADEKEKLRLAKLSDTGIWTIRRYVDEFGNQTSKRYISNHASIIGKFSNSATEGSELEVRFLINSTREVAIKLFEYAGNNPVKSTSERWYRIAIQDGEGSQYVFSGVSYSDRIGMDIDNSLQLQRILRKGGVVKFVISEGSSVYSFEVKAEGFLNAYTLLDEPLKQ
jgi:hypothetical protein